MRKYIKEVSGQLLDKETQDVLADVNVKIDLIEPKNKQDKPRYEAVITTDEYRPDLDNKTHLLSINEELNGEVFIHIIGIPGKPTKFKVDFRDSVWRNLDWFKSL